MSSTSIPASQPRSDSPSTSNGDKESGVNGAYRIGYAYGRLIHRFRWLVLALWLVGLVIGAPFAARLSGVLESGGYSYDGSEASHANNTLINKLHWSSSQALIVFQSTTLPATDPQFQAEVNSFMGRAKGFAHVTGVSRGGVGLDSKTTYVVVSFNQNSSTIQQSMKSFRLLLPASGPAHAYLTGDPETFLEYNAITQQDIEHAETVTLPIALIVLLIVFGTLVAALMPLLLAVVAVPVALALLYAVAVHTWTSIFVLNVATVVGLGISIDYSLFMVRRFRDELAKGRDVRDAIAWSVATTGEAILFSGLAVMVGFCGLFLIGIPFMTSFGLGGALTVVSSVLAALTLMPAILAILGHRINALRLPFLRRRYASAGSIPAVAQESAGGGFWHSWALAVMRRPLLVVVGCAALLLLLGWPIFSMQVATYGSVSLPQHAEAEKAYTILGSQFPASDTNPIYVVVQTRDGSTILTNEHLSELDGLSQWLASQKHVTSMSGLTHLPVSGSGPALSGAQLVALYTSGAYVQSQPLAAWVKATTTGDTTVITLTSDTKLDSSQGTALIDTLRAGSRLVAPGLQVQIGGTQALSLDFTRYLYTNFPRTILFVLATTYLLLLLMFRSLLLPLKAVLVNVLSLAASYGVLVFVFQWGHFSSLLDFTSSGFVDSTMPILIFCVLFGLSMDYEVFLLSRIHEEWLRTHDNRYAVARGLEKTGGVITNAALLFAIVTAAFTFTSLVTTKELGLGMTVAVLVDATIIRTLLVPATMRLLGRWNWWLPGLPLPPRQSS
jgi:putative drug exporter of the RND superfamily